jgi:hypothetical protein
MAGKVNRIMLADTMVSQQLEIYFGEYAPLFPIQYCKGDDKEACNTQIKGFIENERLLYNDKTFKVVAYPVVLKGDMAYIIPSVKSFEKLVGCGTLENNTIQHE